MLVSNMYVSVEKATDFLKKLSLKYSFIPYISFMNVSVPSDKLSPQEYGKILNTLMLEDVDKSTELINLLTTKKISPNEFFEKQREREIEYRRKRSEIEKLG